MKKNAIRFFLLLFSLCFLAACSGGSDQTQEGGKKLLGSYEIIVNPADGSVTVLPLDSSRTKPSASLHTFQKSRAMLGWPESIGQGKGGYFYANPVPCVIPTFNPASRILTGEFQLRSTLGAIGVQPECATPGSQDYNLYCTCDPAHPNYADCGKRLLGPMEVKVFFFGPVEVVDYVTSVSQGPLVRADLLNLNHDSGCSDVATGPCFWNDAGYVNDLPNYKNTIPAWDMKDLLNNGDSDFDLDPAEESGCKPIQFFFGSAGGLLDISNPNNMPAFSMQVDVLGFIEGAGTFPNPPTVGATPARTTSTTLSLTVTIDAAADRVVVMNGASETTCIDNDACDSNGAVDTVVMDVTLNANQPNDLNIHQGDGVSLSPSELRTVIHDNISPVVISVSPINGSVNVSVGSNVFVVFAEALDPATVAVASFTVTDGGGPTLCSSVTLSPDGTTATCLHVASFPASTLLDVTVTTAVTDLIGNTVSPAFTSQFTTGSNDPVPPNVDSVNPPNNAAGFPPNANVVVTFTEAMMTSTIVDPATNLVLWTGSEANCPPTGLTSVGVSVSQTIDQLQAVVDPTADLSPSQEYTVSVNTSVQDVAGNAMSSDYCSRFTTSAVADTTPPTLVTTTPASGSTNVAETVLPELVFSEAMDPSTINTANITFKKTSDQTPVVFSVSLSIDGTTATLVPVATLALGTEFTITVLSSVTDVAGNLMGSPQAITFSTTAIADIIPPEIILQTPLPNSADNPQDLWVTISFSEPIDSATINTAKFTLTPLGKCGGGPPQNTPVASTVVVSADRLVATLKPDVTLCKKVLHQVDVDGGVGGVSDLAGNEMAADYSSTFYTSKKDTANPSVIDFSPGGGVTGVGTNVSPIVTFDQWMDATTITSANIFLSLVDGGCPSGTGILTSNVFLDSDSQSAHVDPLVALAGSTTYQINVQNTVQDISGKRMDATMCDTFTTGAGADTTNPSVNSTNPANGATGWARWQSMTVTFSEAMDFSTIKAGTVDLIRDSDQARIAASLTPGSNGTVLTINPVNLLASLASYHVNLKTSIRDVAGLPLDAFTSFSFTTVDTSGDVTPPSVTDVQMKLKNGGYVSACGAGNIDTDTKANEIRVYLSEAIDPDTAIAGIFSVIQEPGGNNTDITLGSVTIDMPARDIVRILTFDKLKKGKPFRIQVLNDVVDDADLNLTQNPYTCDFGT